jgi:hypothetical protein
MRGRFNFDVHGHRWELFKDLLQQGYPQPCCLLIVLPIGEIQRHFGLEIGELIVFYMLDEVL